VALVVNPLFVTLVFCSGNQKPMSMEKDMKETNYITFTEERFTEWILAFILFLVLTRVCLKFY
jgi:hypothetical protein